MAKTSSAPSREIFEAALQGLEAQRQKLDDQIAQVRSLLGRRVGRPPKGNGESEAPAVQSSRSRRTLSDEARRRIAAAQKKRWAAYRKGQPKA